MKKKHFNPNEWLPREDAQGTNSEPESRIPIPESPIERALTAIEASGIDITGDYTRWRDIGYALCSEFGEGGREYYHRVSRFHKDYTRKACDAQYSSLLKSNGSGIILGTFFHYVKEAGIETGRKGDLGTGGLGDSVTSSLHHSVTSSQHHSVTSSLHHSVTSSQNDDQVPLFPDKIFPNLPEFLQQVVAPATSDEERDLLLLGSLASISACFPKLYGIYDGKKVFPNLYLFVAAPASAGKGRLSLCKELVRPVHIKLREEAKLLKAQYASEVADFNLAGKDGKEKPNKPPERMLFIPANNSTTGMFQLISDNNGQGLIFETEGDTLSASFKSDYGNFSDGFRKAFHHETISYYRRTDREYVDIEAPCLSTVLSGTPKQVATLIPSAENGLFSRFIFYYMQLKPGWKDVFEYDGKSGLDDYFRGLGWKFFELYKTLNQEAEIKVLFTEVQKKRFGRYFSKAQIKYLNLQPEEYIATVRRSGLICFRMSMLLTGLRIMEDGDTSAQRTVEDRDFDSVMEMMDVLLKHSSRLYSILPEETQLTRKVNKKERFLEALPGEFSRKEYQEIAEGHQISHKSADHYINEWVKNAILIKEDYNRYLNPEKGEGGEKVPE